MRTLPPRYVITWDKAARIVRNLDIWKEKESVVHRLPQHYVSRYWQNLLLNHEAVHWTPHAERYTWNDKYNIRQENENYPVLVIYPPEADQGLWGGEGVVKGYELSPPWPREKRFLQRNWVPKYWFPKLMHRVLYSEILDKYMKVVVTPRTIRLIDQNYGLDFYLLKTSEPNLHSKLGCQLKRALLLALARCQFGDNSKSEELMEKYGEFVIPAEEAEWIGLDLNEACRKLQLQEKATPPVPLMEIFQNQKLPKDSVLVEDNSSAAAV